MGQFDWKTINFATTKLDLGFKSLSLVDIQELCNLLKDNDTVVSLDLSGNKHFRDAGCEKMANLLRQNHTLQWLKLYNCKISDQGVAYLVDSLKDNKSLQILALGENRISDDGALFISAMMKSNDTIIDLDLEGNTITNVGAKHIADALAVNKSLEAIDLSNNAISDQKLLKKMAELCDRNIERKENEPVPPQEVVVPDLKPQQQPQTQQQSKTGASVTTNSPQRSINQEVLDKRQSIRLKNRQSMALGNFSLSQQQDQQTEHLERQVQSLQNDLHAMKDQLTLLWTVLLSTILTIVLLVAYAYSVVLATLMVAGTGYLLFSKQISPQRQKIASYLPANKLIE